MQLFENSKSNKNIGPTHPKQDIWWLYWKLVLVLETQLRVKQMLSMWKAGKRGPKHWGRKQNQPVDVPAALQQNLNNYHIVYIAFAREVGGTKSTRLGSNAGRFKYSLVVEHLSGNTHTNTHTLNTHQHTPNTHQHTLNTHKHTHKQRKSKEITFWVLVFIYLPLFFSLLCFKNIHCHQLFSSFLHLGP